MTYTKKTWVPGDNILSSDLNNIEDGLEDIFNLNITFNGIKTHKAHLYMMEADKIDEGIKVVGPSPTDGGQIYCYDTESFLFIEFGGYGFEFIDELDNPSDITAGLINDINFTNHHSRHFPGGADDISSPYRFIVDWNGGGDYTSLISAIAAASPGDKIFVCEGGYFIDNPISLKQGLIIEGCGASTVIEFVGSYFQGTSINNVTLRNLTLQSVGNAGYLVSLLGNNNTFENINVFLDGNGFYITGDNNRFDNIYFNEVTGNPWWPNVAIRIIGDYNKVRNITLGDHFFNAVTLSGQYNIIRNIITKNMQSGCIGVHISYLASKATFKNFVTNCMIYGNSATGSRGIKIDSACNYNAIMGNIIVCDDTLYNSGAGNDIQDNIEVVI